MNTTTDQSCTRCKGKGFGSWVVQNGICFACNGIGTRAAQIATRDAAKAQAAFIAAIEPVSITVVGVTARRDATFEYRMAFDIEGISPVFIEVEPGVWVNDQPIYLNVAHTIATITEGSNQ